MKNNILTSEGFSRNGRFYFLDYMRAQNQCAFLRFKRLERREEKLVCLESIRVFEEDFGAFIGCFSSLFISAAYNGEPYKSVHGIRSDNQQKHFNGIKSMEPELRPREKMLEKGAAAMTDAELLAMLIGSGTPNETAVDLAFRILDSVDAQLPLLALLDLPGLCRFAGMGIAKSSSIMAAMELARRLYPVFDLRRS